MCSTDKMRMYKETSVLAIVPILAIKIITNGDVMCDLACSA